ncbi:hypothetical protein ELQ35_05000 [Peribacillus cavernae]|uniref:Excalibur calcium-binding domain-containing protein n=1 Tax=Peribacillus cavernae TaxID=1674310 RepID=A0A3S0TZH0_9BACI|nr:excalibur calcium-binding domain-containing protein [Peribacillus cavernae]MDQ0218738.1 hypothetical protein [Peribacillus cavernae]RUQ30951.1 hypothetical protein ELQ35_05000 [Peribacillus cavernae]
MQKWIGNKPTIIQKSIISKFENMMRQVEINYLHSDEVVLKVIEAEFDKKSGNEVNGLLVITNQRFMFFGKNEQHVYNLIEINDFKLQTDGKDKNEQRLILFIGRFQLDFDDLKKNDDTQEFLDILEQKLYDPNIEILTTVTHDFEYFLHETRLDDLKKKNIKITPFLLKRDDMGLSKNGTRLLKEIHPHAQLIVEGFYQHKQKEGNFIVIDKDVLLYHYDNKKHNAKLIRTWYFGFFNGMQLDHFAFKTEISGQEGKLVLNSEGKQFESILTQMGIAFIIKTRRRYKKILGFRSGKWWKKSIASLTYLFILLFSGILIFSEDTEESKASTISTETKDEQVQNKEQVSEKKKQEKAARLAEEKKKQEETARIAEEKRKKEEATRLAEEKKKKEEAALLAEEKKEKEEADRIAAESEEEAAATVSYKNCTAVREAGVAPIHKGEPGYAKHLDRDGDGIGCDR